MEIPETRYARSGELFIAYQVFGEGPIDLVLAPAYMSHVEMNWDWPPYARFLTRLGSFARVIMFDRRGTGLSDRFAALSTFEETMDDIRAVMDAVGSERAALVGAAEGGAQCAVFAATNPERTAALVLWAAYAKGTRSPDYPWGRKPEVHDYVLRTYEERYGRSIVGVRSLAPSLADRQDFRRFLAKAQRYGASPGAAAAWYRMTMDIDIRHVLPLIRVPTLVAQRAGDAVVDIGSSRHLAAEIPGAQLVELPGEDHAVGFSPGSDDVLNVVQEFLTGERGPVEVDRVLATVLFTDIVGSTDRAAALGDHRWRDLLDEHDSLVRREIERHRGREVKATGDGFLATFDGPARAIRCAQAIRDGVRSFGIEVRAGLHTGEAELRGEDVGGLAVHIGARVLALAGPGEVLASSTVKDLVVGSGIEFEDRGAQTLKGVPGEWRLFSVVG